METATKELTSLTSEAKYIPWHKMFKLLNQGLNYAQVGRQLGISKQAVHQRANREGYIPEELKAFKESKADIFEHLQQRLVFSIDQECINKAGLYQRAWVIGVLEDKIRLMRGQSTDNLSIQVLSPTIDSLTAQIDSIRKSLTP